MQNSYAAANHDVIGVRVSWKMVPAVRETFAVHAVQRQIRPPTWRGSLMLPQLVQTNWLPHRSQSR